MTAWGGMIIRRREMGRNMKLVIDAPLSGPARRGWVKILLGCDANALANVWCSLPKVACSHETEKFVAITPK
jgi:hypothetical protein